MHNNNDIYIYIYIYKPFKRIDELCYVYKKVYVRSKLQKDNFLYKLKNRTFDAVDIWMEIWTLK